MLAEVTKDVRRRLQGIRLVLMDIDGTLVRGNDDTIDNVIRQLSRLKARGVRFSIATGRTVSGASRIVRGLLELGATMPPLIAYNGAVIAPAAEAGLVQQCHIPYDVASHLFAVLDQLNVRLLIYTFRAEINGFVERVYCFRDHQAQTMIEPNGMAIDFVVSLHHVDTTDLTAVLVDCGDTPVDRFLDIRDRLIALFGDSLRITSSGTRYVEIAALGVSKLSAMHKLANIWGIQVEEILAIGDGLNDLEMLLGAGVGAAVANAPTEVKLAASLVASRSASEGVVEILRVLVSELRDVRMQTKASLK